MMRLAFRWVDKANFSSMIPTSQRLLRCTYNDEGFASRPNLYELPMRWIVAPYYKVKLDQAGE